MTSDESRIYDCLTNETSCGCCCCRVEIFPHDLVVDFSFFFVFVRFVTCCVLAFVSLS